MLHRGKRDVHAYIENCVQHFDCMCIYISIDCTSFYASQTSPSRRSHSFDTMAHVYKKGSNNNNLKKSAMTIAVDVG